MALKLDDLKFGTMNRCSDDNATGVTGDPRRTKPLASLRRTSAEAYSVNTLGDRAQFEGIVVLTYPTDFAGYADTAGLLLQYQKAVEIEDEEKWKKTVAARKFAYKVFVPELDCRPIPAVDDPNDPVTVSLPEVYANIPGLEEEIPSGTAVMVHYKDPATLYGPTIVRVITDQLQVENTSFNERTGGGRAGFALKSTWAGAADRTPAVNRRPKAPKNTGGGGRRRKGTLTFEQYDALRPYVEELLAFIAKKESGKTGYEAVNRGKGGDTPGGSIKLPNVAENLTDMTIAEVQSYMKGFWLTDTKWIPAGVNAELTGVGGKTAAVPNGSVGFLAAGKYQIIPRTMYGAVRSTGLDASKTMYDEKTQERLGVYLVFDKRPKLGAYLLGKKGATLKEAAQQAAYEWASLPVQYTYAKTGCTRGYSAYCKGGANATEPLSTTPEFVTELLERTRDYIVDAASWDPIIAELVTGKKPKATAVATAGAAAEAEPVSSTAPVDDPGGLPAWDGPPEDDPVNWDNEGQSSS